MDDIGEPVFAVDRGGKYRDRIYAVWDELNGGRYRLVLAWSSDRGMSWATPKPVDPDTPPYASQFHPKIAVSPEGVLGIFWDDTTGFRNRHRFNSYFTASVDGGETFLPKRLVSTEPSRPFAGLGDLRPVPFSPTRAEGGMLVADFQSGTFRGWAGGGDYIGMTADRNGVFHPFWADARSGTYQLYTAAIRVRTGPQSLAPAIDKAPAKLAGKITLVFDPIRYNPETHVAVISVRLRNVSSERLYAPFRVEIKELSAPSMPTPPAILNASNGKVGVGAVFDYSRALGDLNSLDPGAVTDAFGWRLRMPSAANTAVLAVNTHFHLGVSITGFVSAHPSSSSATDAR